MRVLLSTYGSRGDVEPVVGLAVQLRALGAEVRVCAPPDKEFAELLAGVGVPLVPFGQSVRALVTGATPSAAAGAPRLAAELVAAHFDTAAAAAEGCDVLVATGLMPAGARSVTASDRRGRHDPHRWGDSGRDAAARRGQLRKVASVRVNHAGSSSPNAVQRILNDAESNVVEWGSS